uniref:STAS domain-containing protein n=1 Tax=Aegilops tauschii subsp. strangulata TaxID=200361 RepID=A0A453IRF3_AEGTS
TRWTSSYASARSSACSSGPSRSASESRLPYRLRRSSSSHSGLRWRFWAGYKEQTPSAASGSTPWRAGHRPCRSYASIRPSSASSMQLSSKRGIMEWVRAEVDTSNEKVRERVHSVVLDMSNVVNIDTSGLVGLEEIHKELASLGIQMAIASPGWQAIQKMKLAHVVDRIGEDWIFLTVGEAVEGCLTAHKGSAMEC